MPTAAVDRPYAICNRSSCWTDIALPGRSGIELIRELCALASRTCGSWCSPGHTSEEYIRARAQRRKRTAMLLKGTPGARSCCIAIRSALAGRTIPVAPAGSRRRLVSRIRAQV